MRKFLEDAKKDKGSFLGFAIAEFIVFFCATFGFSDYVLNTSIFKKTGWVDDDKLVGSIVTAYVVPGIFIVISYLRGHVEFDLMTLIPCMLAYTIGTTIGSNLMLKIDSANIRKIIGFAMIFSMFALVLKLVISSGASGTLTGLKTWQFAIAIPICLIIGIFNMMGVPMKPPLMSLFLLLGLSPLVTVTILMCMCVPGIIFGSIPIFKSGRYNKKAFISATIFGSLAAILGGTLALSINALALTIVLLIAMGYVSYTMLKK